MEVRREIFQIFFAQKFSRDSKAQQVSGLATTRRFPSYDFTAVGIFGQKLA
jgi:hypothetical protein